MKTKNTFYKEVVNYVNHVFADVIRIQDSVPVNPYFYDLAMSDTVTAFHSLRVAIFSHIFADIMELSKPEKEALVIGALLHDIGKGKIPLKILNKESKLTPVEFEIIQAHTVLGYEHVKNDKRISDASKYIILYHHENWNGTGYFGKIGFNQRNIDRLRDICHISDVLDAMLSNRPYKDALPVEVVIEYIKDQNGIMFSPECSSYFDAYSFIFQIANSVIKKNTMLANFEQLAIDCCR